VSIAALEASPATRPAAPARPAVHPAPGAGGADHGGPRRHLRLVSPPPTRASGWRRRAGAVLVLATLLVLLVAAIGGMGASADLEDRVAGHVVLEPGETLWDVAVATAPDGVDPRAQLGEIKDLNGFGTASVDAWTVVLLPAR
jgi:hypothetical protein